MKIAFAYGGAALALLISTAAQSAVGVVHRKAHVRKAPAAEGTPVARVQPGDHVQLLSPHPQKGYYRVRAPSGGEGYVWHRNVVPVETAPATHPAFAHSRAEPVNKPFDGCGPAGSGGDTATDILKDRVDVPTDYKLVDFASLVQLPYPANLSKSRVQWTADQHAAVTQNEGTPIQAEGYLFDVKQEGPESANCKAADPAHVDWHMWLLSAAGDTRVNAVVVEVTPRIRAMKSAWQYTAIQPLAKEKAHVRISGWLMMDPLHPEQLQKTRGTLWEIHPITKIEVEQSGAWVDVEGAVAGNNH